jgi:hypothetical protein
LQLKKRREDHISATAILGQRREEDAVADDLLGMSKNTTKGKAAEGGAARTGSKEMLDSEVIEKDRASTAADSSMCRLEREKLANVIVHVSLALACTSAPSR